MHLIELFLPLKANDGTPIEKALLESVRKELLERFGGVTAHSRAPVSGWWDGGLDEGAVRDDLLILEVMVDTLDTQWWGRYRQRLEQQFGQEAMVVRAFPIQSL